MEPRPAPDLRIGFREEGMASVCLIVGGTFQGLTAYADVAAADVVIYVDVQSEVSGVSLESSSNVITLRLATGETLGTLTRKNCSAGVKRFLEERSGVTLNVGLGQLRAVGAMVAEQLLADPAFQEFLVKEVFERLLQIHNGCLEHIDIQVATSIAGGTGSAVGPMIAKALAKVMLQFSNATLHVQALRVGSLSFSGLGDRVHVNGAASLAEEVENALDRDRHPREMRTLLLVENPMVGPQKVRRDAFVLQLMQALRAQEVQSLFGRSSPNEALNSSFGTIHILRASFFQELSDRQWAADVASIYAGQLEEILRVGMKPGMGEEVSVKLVEEGASHLPAAAELAEQVRRAKGVLPPALVSECVQSPFRYACERLLVSNRDQLPCNLRSLLSQPGATRAALTERLGVLRALRFRLQQKLQQCRPALETAKKRFEAAELQLRASLASFFPNSWLDQFAVLFNNPKSNLIRFQNAVRNVRQCAQAREKIQAEHDGLQSGLTLVQAELTAEENRVRRAVELLQGVGGSASQVPFVRPGPLDQILVKLLDASACDLEEVPASVFRLLASCARQVTIAGLAAIVGSSEPRIHQVATSLAQAKTLTRGPAWGGKRNLGAKRRILVLPPMLPEDVESVRRNMGELDPELIVVSGDHAQASVNVVLLEVFSPQAAEDIFTPFHLQHLRKARSEPELYFTNGADGSRWLADEFCDAQPSATKGV